MRLRFDLERAGTGVVLLLTLVTIAALGVVFLMKSAAADLRLQVDIVHVQANPDSRSPWIAWLSTRLASDLPPADYPGMEDRAGEIDHRSDRLVEATAVVALVGMLVALVSGGAAGTGTRSREEANNPLASTSSNGTV